MSSVNSLDSIYCSQCCTSLSNLYVHSAAHPYPNCMFTVIVHTPIRVPADLTFTNYSWLWALAVHLEMSSCQLLFMMDVVGRPLRTNGELNLIVSFFWICTNVLSLCLFSSDILNHTFDNLPPTPSSSGPEVDVSDILSWGNPLSFNSANFDVLEPSFMLQTQPSFSTTLDATFSWMPGLFDAGISDTTYPPKSSSDTYSGV